MCGARFFEDWGETEAMEGVQEGVYLIYLEMRAQMEECGKGSEEEGL